MSSLSSDEGNGFSTQDQEIYERLVSMDRETFLRNYTGLESTRLMPVHSPPFDPMDTDSDDSMELEPGYGEPVDPPQPQLKPVVNKPVIQGSSRTRTLRQRNANQLKPYTYDRQNYDAMVRRACYPELLQKDTQRQHRRKTAEDRYEQDDGDDSDDEEYDEPSLDPEELPTQSMEELTLVPSRRRRRRRASDEKIKAPTTKPSRTSHSETPPPPRHPPNDIWTAIPRTTTTYSSKKKRSAQEKGKSRANPLESTPAEPEPLEATPANNVPAHIDDCLRGVFSNLYSEDDDSNSLDSDLARAEQERLEQEREQASLEAEDEEVHYNSRRRRARRIDSLESDDDTPNPHIFDFPMDPEPSHNPQVFDVPPERPKSRRRYIPKEDDGFVEHDGSAYDRPVRKKKRTTTRGVLPYNFVHQNLPKPSPIVIEETDDDDSPSSDQPRSPSPPPDPRPVSSSRSRERMVGEFIQASSSSAPRAEHRRSAAQNSRTARKNSHTRHPKSAHTSSSSRKQQASSSSSSSIRTSITPRKAKHKPKRADPNGKLYIVPGPDWESYKRPHLTNGWAPNGEHRPRSSDQARITREWTTQISEHDPPRQHPIHHRQRQAPASFPLPASPISPHEDTGPTNPFARLLHEHPSLATDYGIPSAESGAHLHGTCYIMLGYLQQVLSPEVAVPSIGAFETFIELFGRKITLTQDVDQTTQSIKSLFREVFKRIGPFFEKRSTTAVEKDLEIANLMPIFRFVSERLANWALRLGGGQQRPTMEFLNNQCKLMYARAWAIAGMIMPYNSKTPPLLDKPIGHSSKVLLILMIYALDWTGRFGTPDDRNDCLQRLLWLLYWIGPDYAQLLRRDDNGLTAKEPLVAEAWICVLHTYLAAECWQRVMQLLDQQSEQDGWTAAQKKQHMFHWLLVLNGLRHVDQYGVYTTPQAGLSSVEGLCGHELALELITATAL
ncbi:hypothetical protein BJV82DRAFT_608238 [Fennellomyces sp. T-0311]|nr:hypothetical protein BJV82DRAFT_608238 [Fennellomyces sp. T-0311]